MGPGIERPALRFVIDWHCYKAQIYDAILNKSRKKCEKAVLADENIHNKDHDSIFALLLRYQIGTHGKDHWNTYNHLHHGCRI